MVLPLWTRGGRPITIPLGRQRSINLPNVPFLPIFLLLLLLLGIHRVYTPFYSYNPYTGRTNSPFAISPHRFIAPPAHDPPPHYFPEPIAPKKRGMVVPDSVHYVYGLKPPKEGQETDIFPYYAYLAMRSAIIRLEPKVVYFHYKHLPRGPWWDMIVPHLTLVETESPEWILGRKLGHYAHKADVLRLLAMKYSGGIYLDIDVFVVKPFDDLLYFPTTLAMEESPDQNRNALDPTGLCNAVIIAQPHADFIDRWIASYETFDDNAWADHSVNMPWTIARRYPDEVQVLSIKAMFWPMWYGDEIGKVHTQDVWDFYGSGQYTYHAWESLAMGHLWDLDPKKIKEVDTSFNRLVRPLVGPEDEAVYQRLHA